MRYAITGATGFIGTAISNRLVLGDHTVIPVPRASLENHKTFAHFVDWSAPDIIIHLAAYGNHYNQKDLKETVLVNTCSTVNVFLGSGGRPVYNFTTSSINLPVKTPYAITKQAGATVAELFPNVINVMPYSVYGPGEAAHRFMPVLIQSLITGQQIELDETATHDWIFISSFVDAFMNGHTSIGTGVKHTNLEIVKKLEMISGKKLNYTKKKLRSYDNSDWVAPAGVEHISIDEGLLKTFNYYK